VAIPAIAQKECCSCFGYQLLFAVKLVAEALAKGASQTTLMAGAVYEFVKECGVVMGGIYKAKAGREVD
jgi:hypothetical protein